MKSRSRSVRIAAQLADLKMPGALEALDDVLAGVDGGETTAAEAIERLLAAQITLRNSRRLATAMRSSRLPAIKTLEDFDFSFQPSIKREQIDSLHELGFLERKENVVFLGPPGVGKTHLAISLAITTAESGRRVYYGTLTDLIDSLEEAEAAGRLNHRLKTLTHPALLVVDEIGYLPVTRSGAILFFQLVNRRYEHASTVVTSNKGFEQWGEILHDEVMAAALLDRLLHRCHIVNIRGNSYRMRRHMELSKAIHPTASRAVSAEHSVMMGVRTPSGAPAPVAPLPPWRLPKSVHFSMATSVHFSVAIDTRISLGSPAPVLSPKARWRFVVDPPSGRGWVVQVVDVDRIPHGLEAEVASGGAGLASLDAAPGQPDTDPERLWSRPLSTRHLHPSLVLPRHSRTPCSMQRPIALLAFLALSWFHVAAIRCATGGSMIQGPAETAMPHHDGASPHAGRESSHSHQHEDPGRGEGARVLACAVTSGEPLRPADLRSFPGVAFQAGPFVQQALSIVASSVDPPPPRHDI